MSKVDVIYNRIEKIENDLQFYNLTISHYESLLDQHLNDAYTENIYDNLQKLLKIHSNLVIELNDLQNLIVYIKMLGGDISRSDLS